MMTRCALRLPRGGAFRSATSSPSVRRLWSTVAPTASARPVAPPAALHTPVCTQHLTPLAPGRPVRCAVDLRALSRRQQLRFSLPATSSSSSAALSTDATTATDETSGNGVSASGAGDAQGPTFQEAVQRLQNYWASVGCAIWLPHNTEVGAGTMNPATFLRVLGPEPWNVAYPEPSVRPDDSRYGDNPNRVQRHTQYQVILKPDPGNPQELYLGSLAALGIDTSAHDVRFVEDNWESPVLGAWGLGWEVWLDGMEVTQFTYFQQAGGQPLVVPAVEITYGLERILMSLQGVNHFKDIRYNETMTYGEMFLQNEYEMSVYNLDEADVEGQRQRFDLFVAEAHRLLDKRLPIPAYDHLLKTSHAFNILDARGAIGVTERAKCFADMRALARRVTQLWGERREEQGFPLGRVQQPEDAVAGAPTPEHLPAKGGVAPFVLEIGSEELPPADVEAAMAQLRAAVPAMLEELKLEHGGVTVEGTPRRLAVMVDSLAAFTKDVEQRLRGPPAKAAFKDGEPTKALQGFARKNGVEVADVVVEADSKGVEYCYAEVSTAGRPAAEALAVALGELIKGLSFKKSMRWNGSLAYSRPLRWVLAMHGPAVVPLVVGDLTGGATTRLLRNAAETEATLGDAGEYGGVMGSAGIEVGFEARKVAIWSAVIAAAKEVGGIIPQSNSEELLLEVANLVEAPTVVRGTFDPSFLKLPRELLVMVMRKHQRYFPVTDPDTGDLMPFFVTVANGPIDPAAVAAGNEAVLRARFEDAVFFYESDLERTLDEFTPALAGTMFQADLGTLLDKTTRVQALVKPLAELMSSTAVDVPGAVPVALRAASLAKADLATSTVMEMTALAGIMGRHYATLGGETEEVATAIWEAILPRNSGDELPASPAGILVSIADRLDSLVGLVAAGCAPSASTDPYALRRTAYAMLQTLVGNGIGVDLRAAASAAAELQPISVSEETLDTALDFVERRLEQLLLDRGLAAQAVRAALAERGSDPALAAETATDLSRFMADNSPALAAVMTSLARPIRIIRGKEVDPDWVVNPELFEQEEERGLWEAYGVVASKKSADMTLAEFLAVAEPLSAPVDAFFDKVFVMADDEKVRANRLALLQQVAALQDGVVDFSQLPGF